MTNVWQQQVQNAKVLRTVSARLRSRNDRTAWEKGVTKYAVNLVDWAINELDSFTGAVSDHVEFDYFLLNGAQSWTEFSWGGSALIYDSDIAETLCTPSELKKTRHGERRPNSREEWLDVQARALSQAASRINAEIFYATT